ncbi:MAG: hypothetical protein Q8L14_04245 [Myxococcales bacterium]|nr:hypothetical protein [Myxococcales bacterium]
MVSFALVTCLAAAPLELAVVSKDVASSTLEVRWQSMEAGSPLAEPFARLQVQPDETFRAVALPGSRSLAIVRVPSLTRDLSFASTLTIVTPGQPDRTLATNVVRASQPVLIGQRLFVERGVPGAESPDSFRVDSLTITEVSVASGRARTVFETKGFWTHLAGVFEHELILYVAGPEGARLIAVNVDTLAVRTLVPSLPALAHDFTVDAAKKAVLFTIAEPGVERWFVERVELLTGRRERLAEGDTVALLPTVLPSGVAYSAGQGQGLRWAGRDGVALPSHGAGFERVRVIAEGLVFVRHEVPGDAPSVYAVSVKDFRPVPLTLPTGIVDVAGVRR